MHGVPNVVCGEVKIIEVQESKKLYFAECLLLTLSKDISLASVAFVHSAKS
jgi:hypothetical protein